MPCCGGGYSYPEGSPYFIQQQYFDAADRVVPLRTGTSAWGWQHIQGKHMESPAAIALTVNMGSRVASGGAFNYIGWVYDRSLWDTEHVMKKANVQVTFAPQLEQDDLPKGIITAYCLGYMGWCPPFVSSGDVLWGGPGES